MSARMSFAIRFLLVAVVIYAIPQVFNNIRNTKFCWRWVKWYYGGEVGDAIFHKRQINKPHKLDTWPPSVNPVFAFLFVLALHRVFTRYFREADPGPVVVDKPPKSGFIVINPYETSLELSRQESGELGFRRRGKSLVCLRPGEGRTGEGEGRTGEGEGRTGEGGGWSGALWVAALIVCQTMPNTFLAETHVLFIIQFLLFTLFSTAVVYAAVGRRPPPSHPN